jgi:hypothetical protein
MPHMLCFELISGARRPGQNLHAALFELLSTQNQGRKPNEWDEA